MASTGTNLDFATKELERCRRSSIRLQNQTPFPPSSVSIRLLHPSPHSCPGDLNASGPLLSRPGASPYSPNKAAQRHDSELQRRQRVGDWVETEAEARVVQALQGGCCHRQEAQWSLPSSSDLFKEEL